MAIAIMINSCGATGLIGMLLVNWPFTEKQLVEIRFHNANGDSARFVEAST